MQKCKAIVVAILLIVETVAVRKSEHLLHSKNTSQK